MDWKRLFSYTKPHTFKLVVAGVLLIFASSFSLLMPLVTAKIVAIIAGESDYTLVQVAVFMTVVLIVQSLASLLGSYLIAKIDASILLELRKDAYSHLQTLPFTYFTNSKSGEIVSRLSYDVMNIGSLTSGRIIGGAQTIIRLLGAIIMMLYLSPYLTLIATLTSPLFILLSWIFGKKYFKLARITQSILALISSTISETSQNIRIIKSFTAEDAEQARFSKRIQQAHTNDMRTAWIEAMYRPTVGLVAFSGILLIFWFGGQEAIKGNISLEKLVAFLMFSGMFAGSIRGISSLIEDYMAGMGALNKVFEMMNYEAEELGSYEPEKPLSGKIQIKDAVFKYDTHTPYVFNKLNLSISEGETVAIIGPSGIGKSTLLNLIPRFYELEDGELLFDDKPVSDFSIRTIRQQIGIVPQDLQLFNGTIMDNLKFAKQDTTVDTIKDACKQANAHEFIEELADGYQTVVGENGLKLSYGQRQRIAIARILIKNPAILLLDEPTSALDIESEIKVMDALKTLMKDRTTIIAGHQLNSLKFADKIVVLGNHGVLEEGSHDKLLANEGYYKRVWNSLSKYENI